MKDRFFDFLNPPKDRSIIPGVGDFINSISDNSYNEYDWNNPNNCSENEWMDEEDYDDFDNF